MRPSKDCLSLIKSFEGYHKRLPNGDCESYPDPGTGGEPWTIGWGTTTYNVIDKYKRRQVRPGDTLTVTQAEQELMSEVDYVARAINAYGVSLTQSQLDTAVSFAYNCGLYNRNMQRLKDGDLKGFEEKLPLYVKGGGRVLQGLVRRRKAELELWRKDNPKVEVYLKLVRTGRKEPGGCEELLLTMENTSYQGWIVRSGQPWAQVFQHGGPENRPGSMMPLPGGEWTVGPIEFAGGKDNWSTVWGPGLGACWVGIEPRFRTRRGAIGFHVDKGHYGTAGCVGFRNNEEMKTFVSALREHDPKILKVDW